jgi:hypothetical protein
MLQIIREDYHYDTVVISRNHLENRGFFPYECKVDEWLKEHDPDLSVWKNSRTNRYRIVGIEFHTIMEVDEWQMNYGIVEHIKKIDSRRGYSAAKELDDSDERVKIDGERRMEDLGYNLAKDTRKIVANL